MKPRFKLTISDTKESVTMLFFKEPKTLEDVLSRVRRALLAWGYSPYQIDRYFDQDKHIKKLEKKIVDLQNELKRKKSRVFSLAFAKEK